MKSKGNSLYEVLKSASRPSGAEEGSAASPEAPGSPSAEAGQATLQERLAAYKAAKLAAANQPLITASAEVAVPRAAASTLVMEPDPTPVPVAAPARIRMPEPPVFAPAPAPAAEPQAELAAPAKGLGERVVRLTYNTALFGGMIGVGLLFIAYAVGLHIGKSSILAEARSDAWRSAPAVAPAVPPSAAPAAAPQPVRKEFAIRLGEWRLVSSEERVKALALANDPDLKKALERTGHRNFEKAFITRGKEPRMALYVDRFTDINSESAKAALTAMKNFRFARQNPFAQAVFEELEPH